MCCASREPAQNFKQYIDTSVGTGIYNPITLEEHWNSEHMKDVRRRMMNDEQLTECQVCDHNPAGAYRDYFKALFIHKKDDVLAATDETGYTTVKPVSWDYRISNLCNFKCRMCGDMLSSSWESELKKHNLLNVDESKNHWCLPDVRKQIIAHQKNVVAKELAEAVEEHRVEEMYWVGGEPLMMEEHWQTMKRIIELGDGDKVYARYNTNLSQVKYKGIDLFDDILPHVRDWQICASMDATEERAEYIRTGLNYTEWLHNYNRGVKSQTKPGQMRLDLTMTLPGFVDLMPLFDLSVLTDTQILTKMTFAFTPDIYMSPMCLPRDIIDETVDAYLEEMVPKATWKQQSLINVLKDMKTQMNFEEQWPIGYGTGIAKGKGIAEVLEEIRGGATMLDMLKINDKIYDWWEAIEVMSEEEYQQYRYLDV